MKICLIGYGKMGKAIEIQALKRGHTIISKLGSSQTSQLADYLHEADVAIEFTKPESALDNILVCFEHETPIVSGTTGWTDHWDEMLRYQKQCNGSLIWASNFSVGVNILFELNKNLAALMQSHSEFHARIEEIHHTKKLDSPSGTGLSLAKQILHVNPHYTQWKLSTDQTSEHDLVIDSIRMGDIIGTHHVKYRSEIDEISISHEAFSRDGFALGAVLAAEWIENKNGVFSMSDVLGLSKS